MREGLFINVLFLLDRFTSFFFPKLVFPIYNHNNGRSYSFNSDILLFVKKTYFISTSFLKGFADINDNNYTFIFAKEDVFK